MLFLLSLLLMSPLCHRSLLTLLSSLLLDASSAYDLDDDNIDDGIDDDDVSIWPPIHLLILKALRIIGLHYVDTHYLTSLSQLTFHIINRAGVSEGMVVK